MSNLQFNYITLTITCHALLKKILADIKSQLKIEHLTIPFCPGESVDPTWPFIVLSILGEAKEVEGMGGEALRRSPQMEVVAKFQKDYLDNGTGVLAIK